MKTVIVAIVVGIVAFFALKSVFKLFTGKSGCGCSSCGTDKKDKHCNCEGNKKH